MQAPPKIETNKFLLAPENTQLITYTGLMIKVLFVCRANICRSPTAHGVFHQLVEKAGLTHEVQVDSAGTHAPYPGRLPDQRAQKVAMKKGYNLSSLHAQQLTSNLVSQCDYLVVMDDQNYQEVSKIADPQDLDKIALLLSYTGAEDKQLRDPFFSGSAGMGFVPDPVDSGERAFTAALGKIEHACSSLLEHIRRMDNL